MPDILMVEALEERRTSGSTDSQPSMFAHYPYPVALIGADGAIRATNFALDRLLVSEDERTAGKDILDFIAPQDAERARTALIRASRLERVPDFTLLLVLPSGRVVSALATLVPADPLESGLFLVLRDLSIDANAAVHDQLALGERTLLLQATVLDSLPAHVALLDSAGRITAVNEAWRRFGRENGLEDPAYCIGDDYLAMCRKAASDSPEAAAVLGGLAEILAGTRDAFEIEYPCHGPARRWFRVHINPVSSSLAAGAVVWHVEVTEQRLADEAARLAARALRQLSEAAVSAEHAFKHRLDHAMQHDVLTGLANRDALESFARQAIQAAAGQPGVCALILINIDGFRSFNESLGHTVADGLLARIAERLRDAVPPGDLVARLGADEFAVVLAGVADAAKAHAFASRICERVRGPIALECGTLSITVGVGISCYPDDGEDFERLLRAAGIALREAKKSGANAIRAYEPHMSSGSAAEWSLRRDMAPAIRAGQFAVFYQPTIHLGSGRPCSVEALVRWRHPERGLLTPDKFIALAEESGAIIELGEWVLQSACQDAMRMSAAIGCPVRIAVNLSARQFECADLGERIARALAASGLTPANLRLEITESTVMADPTASCSILSELASMGVSLALDDFGTGYSSLGYLQKFPLTCLKIDRSFVAGLPDCDRAAAITRVLVLLGKTLRMRIVAEGVENQRQLDFLRTSGCDEVQGFIFAKAMPYEEALAWLTARYLPAPV